MSHLKLNNLGKNRITLSFSFVVVHTTFLSYSMQFDQSEISSQIICKATYMYMYDSVNIHCNTLVMDDGECLILVNISMFCNRGKNVLAETYLAILLILLHC